MTGIDLFLNTEIRNKEYMHGYENLHYGIFKILIDKKCQEFFKKLLNDDIDFESYKFQPPFPGGYFDFLTKNKKGKTYFWEMKIWDPLSQDQFEKQNEFLKNNNALVVYVLFTKAGCTWIKNDKNEQIDKKIDGNIIMVGEKAVLEALEAIELQNYESDVKEVVESYKNAVKQIYDSY